jgi:ribosome-binding protein aMBF1 (putative translation factor)
MARADQESELNRRMTGKSGGQDRVSTKAKLTEELAALGRVLALTRERLGLKQSDVAASLGLPASWLSKIEAGTRRIDPVELIRLAEAMEIDPGELVREIQKELAGRQGSAP